MVRRPRNRADRRLDGMNAAEMAVPLRYPPAGKVVSFLRDSGRSLAQTACIELRKAIGRLRDAPDDLDPRGLCYRTERSDIDPERN